ncbi:MAG: nicotinamide-nucleotide amidohydrolase family protein [Deltaproteobacteria bacterium]|nr:nicotinamide-nucleotide amidohydrolase family protein [Deltaproteobacteria bacterium]
MLIWLAIGSEIVSGKTIDLNMRCFCKNLGVRFDFALSCPDSVDKLLEAFAFVKMGSVVVCCGGLGPTSDDITLEIFSNYSGLALEVNNELKQSFVARFANLSDSLLKQSRLPEGFRYIDNILGSAPLIWGDFNGSRWFFLPGVPAEFEAFCKNPKFQSIFSESVARKNYFVETFQIFGQPEAVIYDSVKEITNRFSNFVGFYPRTGVVEMVLSCDSDSQLSEISNLLRCKLLEKGFHFCRGDTTLNFRVHEQLTSKNLTISTIESFTGGHLAASLTKYPGSSRIFLGGLVVYSVNSKKKILNVKHLANPVSPDTASRMAETCFDIFQSDIALATTGVAGPGSDEFGNPEGLFFIALKSRDDLIVREFKVGSTRDTIVQNGVNLCLLLLLEYLGTRLF